MNVFKKIIFVLAGIMFILVGFTLIYSCFGQYRNDPDFLKMLIVGIMMIVMGLFFLLGSDFIVKANAPERIGKTNKYYTRQLLLYAVLMFAYAFIASIKIAQNPSKKFIWLVLIGILIIYGLLIYIAIRHIKNRKHNKIQDGFFEDLNNHENKNIFTMVIDYYWFEDEKMYLRGNVSGKVELNDKFYYYFLDQKKFYYDNVKGIEIEGKKKNSAKDCRATLIVNSKQAVDWPYETVCSSMLPYKNTDLNFNITNPHVLGLIEDIDNQMKKYYFPDYMIHALTDGRFLVRVKRGEIDKNIFRKIYEFFFGFDGPFDLYTVERTDKQDALAVYTDWSQLKLGKKKGEEREKEALVLTFDELQELLLNNERMPLVINPFSKQYLFMPLELIREIVSSEAYIENINSKKKSK